MYIYNYSVAEAEFRRLPRETMATLMSRCQSRIAESQDDILAEIRGLRLKKPAPRKAPPQRKTVVEWS